MHKETINKVNELIRLLDGIDKNIYLRKNDDEFDDSRYDTYISGDHPTHEQIEELCCSLFIKTGQVDMVNVIYFNKISENYKCGPGERDSFGWLTGVIIERQSNILIHCFG